MENVSEELENELRENRAKQEREDDSRETRTQFKIEVDIYKEGNAANECMDSFFKYLAFQINEYPGDLSIAYNAGDDYAIVTCLTQKGEGRFVDLWKDAVESKENDEFANHYGVFCSRLEEEKENPQLSYGGLNLENMTTPEIKQLIEALYRELSNRNAEELKALIALKKEQDEEMAALKVQANKDCENGDRISE